MCGIDIRKSISCGGRIIEIAFVEWPGVAGSFAQNFIELILEESAHEISDHVVIVADVENGRNVQILGGITSNWWRHTNHSSSISKFISKFIMFHHQFYDLLVYFSAQYLSLSSVVGMSPLNMLQRQVS